MNNLFKLLSAVFLTPLVTLCFLICILTETLVFLIRCIQAPFKAFLDTAALIAIEEMSKKS
jgi:hypothetical protein